MDPTTLAATAVAAVAAYLLKLGDAAVVESAKTGGKAAFDWIKAKLTSAAGQEAVADFEATPAAPENAQALQAALVKALAKDPEAATALAKLLADAPRGSGGQSANVFGHGGKVTQISGSHNTTSS